jgi:hypothetical protein
MIDARDLSYKLIELWRQVALGSNDAGSMSKFNKVEPVYVKTDHGLVSVTGAELTEDGIILYTGDTE